MKPLYVCTILLCYAALCWVCWYHFRRGQQAINGRVDIKNDGLVVVYASQSGRAAELARSTARQLQDGQVPAAVLPLDRLSDALLQQSHKILFVVSTYGEGEPPDMAARFAQRHLGRSGRSLEHLRYAVLALGDRQYQHFCGFGHRLCRGLQGQAAQPLFELIEVDRQDPEALTLWQQRVVALGGAHAAPASLQPGHFPARLQNRACINSGSTGAPVYRLYLTPNQPLQWQAGDIACITPGNTIERVRQFLRALGRQGSEVVDSVEGSLPLEQVLTYRRLPNQHNELQSLPVVELLKHLPPLPKRDYSIASIPEEGHIELLVRQMRDGHGDLGLGSGWLTQNAPLHSELQLSIRSNPAFHSPDPDIPLVLIGSGTGMAGLRAHLREREQRGAHDNWLLFGERNAAYDLHFGEDIAAWCSGGHLQRFDAAFSRDGGRHRYVQELLLANGEELQRWIDRGAAIYVCGGRQGMAAGVDTALKTLLTEATMADLKGRGHYRRDVY